METSPALSHQKLPSLDGWRAVSILLVMGAHSGDVPGYPQENGLQRHFPILFDGNLGVRFFFVISGFLITYLLLREWDRTGGINVRAFYARRSLRILPVYFAFLAVSLILHFTTAAKQKLITWIGDFTFTVNYLPRGIMSGHLWSLAVEQQFYLIWPLLFVWLKRRPAFLAAAFLVPVIVALAARAITAFDLSPWILHPLFHHHSALVNFDAMAAGCALAFLYHRHASILVERVSGGKLALMVICALGMIVIPSYVQGSGSAWWRVFGPVVQMFGFAALMFASVINPALFKPLNWAWMMKIGAISYSLYIWQELFCARPETYGVKSYWFLSFPGWMGASFFVAFLSYYCFERPLMGRRAKLRQQ